MIAAKSNVSIRTFTFLLGILCLCGAIAINADDIVIPVFGDSTNLQKIRQAVERSIPFLEEKGVAWIEEQKCSSCHQVPSMLWSLNEVQRNGFEFERQKLDDWTDWTASKMEELEQDPDSVPPVDTMIQHIMGRTYGKGKVDRHDGFDAFPGYIIEQQQSDGSWKAGGQLPTQKRPIRETHEVTTMWTILALSVWEPDSERVTKSIKNALNWLKESDSRESNEWWILKMLVERQWGLEERANRLLEQLIERQNQDGGWSWVNDKPSDAFATGQSLYALHQAELPNDHKAIQRGITYLLETQTEDGSWIVPSTKASENDKPAPTSIYWGTGWAVIGLLNAMPVAE